MPVKRRRLTRLADGELDQGQRCFLLGEDLPEGIGVWAFNRWAWCHNAIERGDPAQVPPDGSPSPRELWEMFGHDALEVWHELHGDTPHPLVAHLGMPASD